MLPNKGYNMPMPVSQTSSGCELGPECGGGEIPTAEAAKGLDAAIRKIDAGKKFTADETVFKSSTTNQHPQPNGAPGLPLMSAAGEALAKKSAPRNAFTVPNKIQSSSVDKIMRGGHRG
ncbi:MAG TPA: hypothetical protein VMJ93_11190 [Verrucomicrobiae bacterium]|nr:hypothetical protein [Verrucomicrobiae bacterium]